MTYALLALSYILGATPTSYVVGRWFHGIDLREHGSGNLGATNAFRVLGLKSALPVVLVDITKGFVPAQIFGALAGGGLAWTFGYGLAAILGHMFSFWVGFKGGKGMATSLGVFIALAPWASLVAFLLWLTLTFATGYVSVGSIAAAVVMPPLIAVTPHVGGTTLVWLSIPLALFVVWAHRANIGRLRRGEENRFGRKGSDSSGGGGATRDGPPRAATAADADPGRAGAGPDDAVRSGPA